MTVFFWLKRPQIITEISTVVKKLKDPHDGPKTMPRPKAMRIDSSSLMLPHA